MAIDKKDICAVIVAYGPDFACFDALLNAVFPQVDGLVVVNNGGAGTIRLPDIFQDGSSRSCVLQMTRNVGVAAAQNSGIDWAKEHGFSHVILFDQDSEPEAGMVEKLGKVLTELSAAGMPVAAVGPRLIDGRDGRTLPFVTFGAFHVKRADCRNAAYVRTDFLVSSGMLAPIEVYENVGMLDAGLFIDNVDLDWCFRARDKKLALYGVCETSMLHQIGDSKFSISIFGRSYSIYQHRPLRQYYIQRNRILLYRRAYAPLAWIIQDMVRAIAKAVFTLTFCSQRRLNFQMMWIGLVDGLRGKSGECV